MSKPNCSECKWCQNNVCENTNWKSGKPIKDPFQPECGYLTSKSKSPIGFSLKDNDE